MNNGKKDIIDQLIKGVFTRNRILGLLCLMGSGPFIAISFWWYTIATRPYEQLITIGTGLTLGAIGTFLLISPDKDE